MTTTLDPTLDQDVADWFATSCDRPRLSLLGPGNVRAQGTAPACRKAYHSELLAFLALRGRDGADVDEICLALGAGPTKLRQDISTLRTWLGTDPRTGEPHLPTLGAHGYRAGDRLLVDLDLFRRLRLRGTARGGDEGLSDLARALELVSGRPFDQQRPGGWAWLSSGERIDVYMTVEIADVALTVTNGYLERGNTDRASAAADIAALAAPDEEVTRLCRVRLDEAVPGTSASTRTWSRSWEAAAPDLRAVRRRS